MSNTKTRKINTLMMVVLAILIAMNIVLSRFASINAWNMKIGFTFVTMFAAAYLYGPIAGLTVGALGDFIGALLFPIGPYFPGFTLDCALTGLVMGLLLYKKQTPIRIVLTVLIDQLIISMLITTLWIHVLYESPYWALLVSRIPQVAILTIVEFVSMFALTKLFNKINAKKLVQGKYRA